MPFPQRKSFSGKLLDLHLRALLSMMAETRNTMFAANRWESLDVIEECLGRGENVVADRYVYSGMAYSLASGVDVETAIGADVGLPKPDLVCFLKIEEGLASQRANFGDEIFDNKKCKTESRRFMKTRLNLTRLDGKG